MSAAVLILSTHLVHLFTVHYEAVNLLHTVYVEGKVQIHRIKRVNGARNFVYRHNLVR